MTNASTHHGMIIVASCVDAGYLPLTLVVARSIARHADAKRPVEYHVLYDGPDHWALSKLARFVHPRLRIVVHRVANPFAELGNINGFPPSTIFRAALPDVLSQHTRALYVDPDVLVLADLAEVFDLDMQGYPLSAVPCLLTIFAAIDGGRCISGGKVISASDYFAAEIGLDTFERKLTYTQAGVQLMDLDALRAMRFGERMHDLISERGDRLAYVDQCAVNTLLRDNILLLDPIWNVSPFAMRSRTVEWVPEALKPMVRRQRQRPAILHFGGGKPWGEFRMRGTYKWWGYALRAGVASHFAARMFRFQTRRIAKRFRPA